MQKRPIGWESGKQYILDQKVPKNPKYETVQSKLAGKTGLTVKDVQIMSANKIAKRKGELFKRIKTSTYRQSQSIYQLGQQEGPFEEDKMTSVTYDSKILGVDPDTDFVLVDMQEKEQFHKCHIKEALNVPGSDVRRDKLPGEVLKMKNQSNKLIILYDLQEKSGMDYAKLFAERGFQNSYLISGGLSSFISQYYQLLEGKELPPPRPKQRHVITSLKVQDDEAAEPRQPEQGDQGRRVALRRAQQGVGSVGSVQREGPLLKQEMMNLTIHEYGNNQEERIITLLNRLLLEVRSHLLALRDLHRELSKPYSESRINQIIQRGVSIVNSPQSCAQQLEQCSLSAQAKSNFFHRTAAKAFDMLLNFRSETEFVEEGMAKYYRELKRLMSLQRIDFLQVTFEFLGHSKQRLKHIVQQAEFARETRIVKQALLQGFDDILGRSDHSHSFSKEPEQGKEWGKEKDQFRFLQNRSKKKWKQVIEKKKGVFNFFSKMVNSGLKAARRANQLTEPLAEHQEFPSRFQSKKVQKQLQQSKATKLQVQKSSSLQKSRFKPREQSKQLLAPTPPIIQLPNELVASKAQPKKHMNPQAFPAEPCRKSKSVKGRPKFKEASVFELRKRRVREGGEKRGEERGGAERQEQRSLESWLREAKFLLKNYKLTPDLIL